MTLYKKIVGIVINCEIHITVSGFSHNFYGQNRLEHLDFSLYDVTYGTMVYIKYRILFKNGDVLGEVSNEEVIGFDCCVGSDKCGMQQ